MIDSVTPPRRLLAPAVALALTTAALSLGGCVNYWGINSDKVPLDHTALDSQQSLPSEDGEWPTQAWWESFNDPQLNQLIVEALQNSPTLAAAAAKVELASATLESARAPLLPSIGLNADATRQRYSENGMYPPPLGGSIENSGDITLQARYELDFWGRNRSGVAASRSRQAAASAEAASTRLMLASAVAKTYFQLAQLQSYRGIADSALKQREDIYQLTKQRVEAGLDTQVELKQAETLLPLTKTNIAQLDEEIVNTQHALAALLGAGPDRALQIQALLPDVTESLRQTKTPSNLPVDLLGHRPDLVAARWQVEAAEHATDATKAAFYPNINLAAFAGYSSIGLDRLLRSSSETYGIGPAISLPIFDAGRLRADLKARYADYDAAVANYNSTLINALHDVADQLNSARSLEPQLQQQQLALDAAQTAYDLAMQRYNAGLGNYLTVLNAQSMVLQQQMFQAQLLMRALTVQVELSRALGGGYPFNDAPESSARTSTTETAGVQQ